ncbi:hypothetical protein [Bifidobacterium platyrrhinorum]|uniref:hypothetical protein n=1 Tax=Bifidobacterium platyrrhinorum TaxID=2661628 RepID=UPI0013D2D945|nr:hypothetical protein [Bifidobacterium platyrrhinorum]
MTIATGTCGTDAHGTIDDGEGRGEDPGIDTSAGPWVERFKEDVDRQYVSDGQIPRATGLITAIVREALNQGFSVPDPAEPLFEKARDGRWPWPHVIVQRDGYLLSFHLAESSRAGTAPKTRVLGARAAADGTPKWIEERSREFVGTGMMVMRVDSDMVHYRQKTSRDTTNTMIEERMPSLFKALSDATSTQYRLADMERKRALTLEQAQRECRSERLYAALRREAALHADLDRERGYLDLVERRLGPEPVGADQSDMEEFRRLSDAIALMRRRIDALDPLTSGGVAWADQPEPTDADVFEYMHRNQGPAPFAWDRPAPVPSPRHDDFRPMPPDDFRPMPPVGDGFFD